MKNPIKAPKFLKDNGEVMSLKKIISFFSFVIISYVFIKTSKCDNINHFSGDLFLYYTTAAAMSYTPKLIMDIVKTIKGVPVNQKEDNIEEK